MLAIYRLKNGFGRLSPLVLNNATTTTTTRGVQSSVPKTTEETPKSSSKATTSTTTADRKRHTHDSSSFVMNLFCGEGKVVQQFPYPQVLSTEDIQIVDMVTEPLTKTWTTEDAIRYEDAMVYDDKLWQRLKDMGSFGIQVPPEYGGMGANATQFARLGEIMGRYDLSLGVVLGAHQSIGFKGILLFGTDQQKQKYLPDLAAGNRIACFCLTEPSAGSDASGIKTKAVLSADGKHYILNGSKIWISNGGIADVFTVFAKTPVKAADGTVKEKVTAFIVERGPGLTSGPPNKKMGIKASNTTEVFFDNVKVPVDNVLGEVGGGFKVAMNILNNGRFGMAGALSGAMRTCIEKATEHATTRTQFGNKISTYGTIQEKIGRMSISHYVTESMAYMLSGIMDKGFADYQLEAAISKVYASEAAWFVCDEAIQILGGMGYMKETGLEKILRDTRIFRIFEGTNDILRLFVSLTGVQYAGGHLKELQRAMNNPVANLGMIFGEGTKRFARSVGLSSGPSLAEYVDPQLRDSAAQVSKSIQNFGASVEHLLIKYNKNIIHEQILLRRLADAAIDIYAMVVVLSRTTRALNKNLNSANIEKNICDVFCSEASDRIVDNLSSLRASPKLRNYESLKLIADEVFSNGGVVQNHPLDP
ncbi:very long-chain specific acyl-CoA dehydrogenase, mitochondrial-like [Oppia nitens]|uniref:very long-chain specific acyl-CoA dehydrogenase, mitochondrial-like n=1 Tax=Oppia nitens TaxID=1686743 RepID=UPI0023DBE3A0|nr:very long-chain specific acyl-CoA dehydrogenase, mitochondrial-like [Oppia nitens]XP_054158627.1 very long-chain specific acyl-CoA dehydrogenase, mitochondrial-like [Oppia nitens]